MKVAIIKINSINITEGTIQKIYLEIVKIWEMKKIHMKIKNIVNNNMIVWRKIKLRSKKTILKNPNVEDIPRLLWEIIE